MCYTIRSPFSPIYHCHWKISINSLHSNESNIYEFTAQWKKIALRAGWHSRRKSVEKMVGMLATEAVKDREKGKRININTSRRFVWQQFKLLQRTKCTTVGPVQCSLNKSVSNCCYGSHQHSICADWEKKVSINFPLHLGMCLCSLLLSTSWERIE